MVLTNYNYEHSGWLPTNADFANATLNTPMQQQFSENCPLRQEKIDFLSNCTMAEVLISQQTVANRNANDNYYNGGPDKPVSLLSSNGYYGFAHCATVVTPTSSAAADDNPNCGGFKSNNLAVNTEMMDSTPPNEMSFGQRNGDKRKHDNSSYTYSYPGEMKRGRIEIVEGKYKHISFPSQWRNCLWKVLALDLSFALTINYLRKPHSYINTLLYSK